MLRITELKLPLDHLEDAIKAGIINRLGISEDELISYVIFRQGHDARKRDSISLVYTLDVDIKNQKDILLRMADDLQISLTPDTTYQFVTQATKEITGRPIFLTLNLMCSLVRAGPEHFLIASSILKLKIPSIMVVKCSLNLLKRVHLLKS